MSALNGAGLRVLYYFYVGAYISHLPYEYKGHYARSKLSGCVYVRHWPRQLEIVGLLERHGAAKEGAIPGIKEACFMLRSYCEIARESSYRHLQSLV